MDLDHFLAELRKSGQHTAFYHFTDNRNLPSIAKHGLLSMQQLAAKGIKIPAPGGNKWSMDADKAAGMHNYVHLCFTNSHPMEFHAKRDNRIIDCTYLRINPEVIKLAGVMITDDVANKRGVTPRRASEMLPDLDLEVIYTRTDWTQPAIKQRLKAAQKYELLIPDAVPPEFIVM